jgi:hypothetical protein
MAARSLEWRRGGAAREWRRLRGARRRLQVMHLRTGQARAQGLNRAVSSIPRSSHAARASDDRNWALAPAIGSSCRSGDARGAWLGARHPARGAGRRRLDSATARCPTHPRERKPHRRRLRIQPREAGAAGGTKALEQPDDVAVRVDVDRLAGGVGGQSGHRAHLAEERRDETRARREVDFADRDPEARRPALQAWVVAQ